MKNAALIAFCLLPLPVTAQANWEVWTVDEKTYAGFCSADADETCATVICENGSATFAAVLFGAWNVQQGDPYGFTLKVDNTDVLSVTSSITTQAGFGPEFFSVEGSLSSEALIALKTGTAASVTFSSGFQWSSLSLAGSNDALQQAGC